MHDDSHSPHQPSDDVAGSGADWDALARFAAGETSAAETASVQAWLDQHPADAALVAFVRSGLEHEVVAPSVDVERALARVRARIDAESSSAGSGAAGLGAAGAASTRPPLTISQGGAPPSVSRGGWTVRRRAGLAAAAVVVATIGFSMTRPTDRAGVSRSVANGATGIAAPRVYETPVGVRDSVTLADGSRVVLAPGSRLVVAAGFEIARVVELEGAAYFDVKHDDAHPFTVHSRGTEIRDIGTAFSVSTDAQGAVQVAVTEGIVEMRSVGAAASAVVELRAGDRGVVQGTRDASPASEGGNGDVVVSRGTVTPEDVAWTSGALSYRDAPMSLVQADLKRWYGVTLQITDSVLLRRTLKMSFAGNSAAEAVDKIALALGAETVQRGDTVVLRMPAR